MAQLEHKHRYAESPRTPTTPTIEQLLRGGGEPARWSPTSSSTSSPMFGRSQDLEDDHGHHQKKSVLTKVKEKAKKLRHTLSKKRHGDEDGNITPSWGVSLDDEDEEDDAEYLGAPMYESEMAPEGYRESARQHPREIPVISEKHVLTSTVNEGFGNTSQKKPPSPNKTTTQAATAKPASPNKVTAQAMATKPSSPNKANTQAMTTKPASPNKATAQAMTTKPASPNKTITETVTEKLAPAYTTVSDATHAFASKLHSFTISNPASEQPSSAPPAQQPFSAPAAPQGGKHANSTLQIWDKGVSVKEYLINKFEPGEDEKALSQVISEAMSPRRTPGDAGVMEKVKEAVTSLLQNGESSRNTASHSATHTSPQIPVSTNAHEVVEEENHGRILQAN
ncbi:low-temperature-induced 65 kDa protein [Quillaja saponaria]|uniref:Low-temperature-induced 65 kDa protein n=1 Tax=Quillaja saponaria TaxID=32244 RepID=A0AAD7PAD8_QUISA|nr:low-temperature-induced 65 kDa protein [Quillaja saponaria]